MVPRNRRDTAERTTSNDGLRPDDRTVAVLTRLRERGGPVELSELAAELVDQGRESDDRRDDGEATESERIRIRLHHADLPRLSDAGVIDYDPEGRLVSLPAAGERPSLDATFELLAHPYRRAVLDSLDGHRTMRTAELVDAVAERLPDGPSDGRPADARARIRRGLHHTHLPKLQGAGAVRYDRGPGLVTATEHADWLLSVCRHAALARLGAGALR